jgi:predicted negative regulator of RcsB-dependent stress response
MTWIRDNLRLAIGILIAVVVMVALAVFGWNQWQATRGAKTQAALSKNQAGAALQSGADAVGTLGNVTAAEQDRQTQVKDGTNEIDHAPAGNSNDAADRAACRLRSYRTQPKCIALLGPVAP